jgi:uncharacterized protein (DUF58 family)
MIPTRRLFWLLSLLLLAAVAAAFWGAVAPYWLGGAMALTGLALLDAASAWPATALRTERSVAGSLSLGVWQEVGIRIHYEGTRPLHLRVFDHYPVSAEIEGLPRSLTLQPEQHADIEYRLRPRQRGEARFAGTQIHRTSPLGLWWRNQFLEQPEVIKVYPNFAAVTRYVLLATDNHLSQIGIRKRPRRGEGLDFHQLREYREGDSPRQVDWKASSRMRKLISREYQDERDQEVVFLIDSGRRMLAHDGELSHFDHTLNAVLLLAYVALRQGDAVGLATFSGTPRWLPPVKGAALINTVLNLLYDLYPSTEAPDYSRATTELMGRHRKRALVVVLTNIRDEDQSDIAPALAVLRRRHLVLLANLREQAVDDLLEHPVEELDDALAFSAAGHYQRQRAAALSELRAQGINCLDVVPERLPVALVNRYLDIKRGGLL